MGLVAGSPAISLELWLKAGSIIYGNFHFLIFFTKGSNMKLKKLNKALVAAGLVAGAAVSMPSQAVVMSDDGTGEVLIYPFYTVQGPAGAPRASLFTITNTTNKYKAVKVRFHEAHNSRDALDFNLYLSPKDVWTGVVSRDNDVAVLTTTDKSCTIPSSIMTGNTAFSKLAYTQTKNNDGGNQSGLRTNEGYLEVIEMGVIDDGAVINPSLTPTTGTPAEIAAGIDTFGEAIKHTDGLPGGAMGAGGVPVGCIALQASWAAGGTWDVTATADSTDFNNSHNDIDEPTGGLTGTALIVQPSTGTVAGYDATALKHFFDVTTPDATDLAVPGLLGNSFNDIHSFKDLNPAWANSRSIQTYPNLAMAFPQESEHYDAEALALDPTAVWGDGSMTSGAVESAANLLTVAVADTTGTAKGNARPVSAVLAKSSIINEYVLDKDAATGVDFRTDVVVTFPTKWYFTDNGLFKPGNDEDKKVVDDATDDNDPATGSAGLTAGIAPFTSQFVTESGQGTACEQFSISSGDAIGSIEGSIFDREEGVPTVAEVQTGGLVPSPAINEDAPDPTSNFFCHEANVMSINDGDILTSRIANGLDATVANSSDTTNSFNINFPEGFNSGWFEMKFDTVNNKMTPVSGGAGDVLGLPAVGFVVEGLVSGATGFEGNFTAAIPHKGK